LQTVNQALESELKDANETAKSSNS